MADYFGYNKTAKGPGNIVSSTMVLASIDGEAVRLVQDCNIQYQRNAQFQYELGSDSVWSIAGQSSGTATMTRSVGDKKLLEPYQPGGPANCRTSLWAKGTESAEWTQVKSCVPGACSSVLASRPRLAA